MGERLRVRRLDALDDPCLAGGGWDALQHRHPRPTVFSTREWLGAWWACFGRGTPLLYVAERGGTPVLLAPFFADAGMVFSWGVGSSDYLDLIGDVTDVAAIASVLEAARHDAPDFCGFLLHHLPRESPSVAALREAASTLDLVGVEQGEQPAPCIDLVADAHSERPVAGRTSLVRHEAWFRRQSGLEVVRHRGDDAVTALTPFFEQHIARWSQTASPSLFVSERHRRFYAEVTPLLDRRGWLRFTEIRWRDEPIAFHFGMAFAGSYLWYKPSFSPHLARRSPGEVLLRSLFLQAAEDGAHEFDFGLGDEAFKYRFATATRHVVDCGLYPPGS